MKEKTKLFIIGSYVSFFILLLITGALMFGLKNDTITAIAKNVCSWAPTITLFILFPRILPGLRRRDFVRSLFRATISVKNILFITTLQILLFVGSILLYSHFENIEIKELICFSWPTFAGAFLNCITSGATGEEAGWRGYLQPIMVKKYGVIQGSLRVGVIWAFWHTPLWFISGEYVGAELVRYICIFIVFIISTAVIIGIIYEKNENILVAVIIHFFVNFTLAFIKSNLLGILFYIMLFYFFIAIGYCVKRKNEIEVSSAEQEELTFSRVNLEDLDEFMKAKIDAFSDDVKQYGFGPTGYDDYEKEKENIANYPVYKMVLNGKIIGGMTCCDQGDGMFWLGGIYIDSKHQNMGIGVKAITFLEKEFPQAKCWRLDTPYKNYRNHHFYEKMGYKKIGETEPKADKDGFYLFVYEKVMQ